MISKGSKSLDPYKNIEGVTQIDIAAYYLNVKSIPSLIHSPLRKDENPSFALYCPKGTEVNYRDFSTGEKGNIWTLLTKMWNCSYREANAKVFKDLGSITHTVGVSNNSHTSKRCKVNSVTYIQCKIREWRDYDIKYWESYGISLKWMQYANVYPISHKIITKDNINYVFGSDKYAYAYVETKEGKTTIKIYQPFNKQGFKWSNGHDKSIISLWTKVPKYGNRICICSSLKDALCLWANTGIPAIALQGEGYNISNTVVDNLNSRFKKVYICLDNDAPGLKDAASLANKTGFINVILPQFEGGKDISDLYKTLNNKEQFKQIILKLFL